MSWLCKDFRLICLLGTMFVVLEPSISSAGWMGFRNDTNETVIIQETFMINGKQVVSRPQKLNSGEAVRDIHFGMAVHRKITIYDGKKAVLYTGNFLCPGLRENVLYSLRIDKNGKLTVDTIKTPVTK